MYVLISEGFITEDLSLTTTTTATIPTTAAVAPLIKPKKKTNVKPAAKKTVKKATKKQKPVKEVQTSLDKFKTQNCKRTRTRASLSYTQFTALLQGIAMHSFWCTDKMSCRTKRH